MSTISPELHHTRFRIRASKFSDFYFSPKTEKEIQFSSEKTEKIERSKHKKFSFTKMSAILAQGDSIILNVYNMPTIRQYFASLGQHI